METLRNAGYTKPGDECNCLSLIRLKFPRFLPRIKAKTLSSICNVPRDSDKYKKCFSFIIWGIAEINECCAVPRCVPGGRPGCRGGLMPGGLDDRTALSILVGWDQYASFLVQPPAASPGVVPTSAVFGASLFLASTRRPRQDRESYQPRCGEYTGGTEINKKAPSAVL